jgi:hypothetical protein
VCSGASTVELVSYSRVAVAESLGQFTNLEEGEYPLLEYWKLQGLKKILRKNTQLKNCWLICVWQFCILKFA